MSSDSYQHYERIMKRMKRSKRSISTSDRAFIELYKDLEKTESWNKSLSSIVDHQREVIEAMKLNGFFRLKDVIDKPTEGNILCWINKMFALIEQHDCIVEKISIGKEDFQILEEYVGKVIDKENQHLWKSKEGKMHLWSAEIDVADKVEPGIKFISKLTPEHEETIKTEGKRA